VEIFDFHYVHLTFGLEKILPTICWNDEKEKKTKYTWIGTCKIGGDERGREKNMYAKGR
jgi:hypothetical protein